MTRLSRRIRRGRRLIEAVEGVAEEDQEEEVEEEVVAVAAEGVVEEGSRRVQEPSSNVMCNAIMSVRRAPGGDEGYVSKKMMK